jgi:hypothetical protein
LNTTGQKTLELDTIYFGGRGLNQPINIVGVELYWQGGKIIQMLKTPVQITKTGRIPIPLDQVEEQENHMNLKTE